MGYVHDRDERGLTVRQREIERMVKKGLTPSQIAKKLDITGARVYFVLKQLREKGIIK